MSFLARILLSFVCFPVWAQAPAIVVGAAVSQTGQLASLAADYRRGLLVWQDEVNAAGGLLGRRVVLDLRDDQSDARRSGELYGELIRGKADLLIGPYGSAATLMASAEAERAQRVLINGAGPSLAVHKRSPRYLFQTTMPNSAYGTGVLELAKTAGLARVLIAARDDQTPREMAEATRDRTMKEELKASIDIYHAPLEDFAPYVAKARTRAEAWLAFGEVHDIAGMLRAFKKLDYAPRLFFARGAAEARLIGLVGQDAEFALGVREYDPRFRTSGNERFAAAFAAKWSAPATFAAAQGYAAGTVLADAVRRARSLNQAKLRDTLAQMETPTVLGGYKVDPQSGEQRAAVPPVVQIQRGRPEVVWPQWLQTATLQPYPQWSERVTLK